MSKKGKTRKIVSIHVDEKKWDSLEDYGVSNKSQWINDQMDKLMSVHDDLQGLEIKLKQVEHEERELAIKKAMILEEMERIKRIRSENANNSELINKAMDVLRSVAGDKRWVQKYYVEFQANKHHIEYTALENQLNKENIEIKDVAIEKGSDNSVIQPIGYIR